MEIADDKIAGKSACSDGQAENPSRRTQAFQQLLERSPNVELTDAMATVCGINEAEFRVYLVILDHPHCSIAEIADILDRDPSTIGKQLKSLLGQEFVTRYPRNAADGGVKYFHVAQSLDKTTKWLQHELDTWTDAVMNQLTELHVN
ncbi:MarR family transcriptional regulator [Haladaptatus sp. DFWS20]|uniref:MarR family transcriptional regulator n=1 Tax=Haladaptatus sp. DFWS20 TaxID=3403467 RepID=UPI003EBD5A8B